MLHKAIQKIKVAHFYGPQYRVIITKILSVEQLSTVNCYQKNKG